MASPVIINSSSPNSIHVPSITPPSRRDNSKHAKSSSPDLPSPSKLVQSKTFGLESGSGAHAVPAHAGFGFASAGSLWRERKFEDDAGRDGVQEFGRQPVPDVSDRTEKSTESVKADTARDAVIGKPKKPRKAARLDAEVSAKGHGQISFKLRNFARDDAAQNAGKTPTNTKPSKTVIRPPTQTSENRTRSVDPSEHTFGVSNLGMQTQAPSGASAANKTGKKAATSRQTKDGNTAAKKPRKGKAKSEAVILKSDDAAQDDTQDVDDQTKLASLQHTEEGKSKKNKGSKPKRTAARNRYSVDKTVAAASEPGEMSLAEIAPEKSAYFATRQIPVITNAREASQTASLELDRRHARDRAVCDLATVAHAAPSRRKEWTPVRDTIVAEHIGATDQDAMSTTDSPKLQLVNLLEDFGYTDANSKMPAARRTASGESLTKRRRIEVEGKCAKGPVAHGIDLKNDPAEPKEKRKKKAVGKKKLPTITALATSAYQPVLDQTSEQSTVSEFFALRKEKDISPKEITTAQEKPKKPRKSRKKKAEAANADQDTAAAAKKSKKTKVKVNEPDYTSKLHSPGRATSQMMQQDFLFGTSSQLVVDESPAFIRDIQAAVTASEMETNRPQRDQYPSQIESSNVVLSQLTTTPRRNKSCAKVPTAPHGTCLSLQQAHRELWCVSSRDNNGGFLRDLSKDARRGNTQVVTKTTDAKSAEQPDSPERREPSELSAGQQSISRTTADDQSASRYGSRDIIADLIQEFEPAAQARITVSLSENRCSNDNLIDLCQSSTLAPPNDAEDSVIALGESAEHTASPKENVLQQQPEIGRVNRRTKDDDSWMLISSDGPGFDARARSPSHYENSKMPAPRPHSLVASSTMRRRSSLSGRDVLQPLDANASLHSPATFRPTQVHHARAFTTTTSNKTSMSPTGRPRGRPRKEASATSATATSPKKRGRPPKQPVIASDLFPKRAKFKKSKAAFSASQPLKSPSGWLDVDEISDSDSPVTPSPPRRRASASPHATPPLDISIDGSPLANIADEAPAIFSAASTFKAGEPQWPAIRDQIFPRITSAIKDAPRVHDPSKPSWYQKILMYDPITLEELTGWLNQQGLRIQAQKQKPKPKKRGRKKRDADGKVLEEESNTEWEVHEEHLQPWMVQKWCEERSICCVWAGGGWGGRARN